MRRNLHLDKLYKILSLKLLTFKLLTLNLKDLSQSDSTNSEISMNSHLNHFTKIPQEDWCFLTLHYMLWDGYLQDSLLYKKILDSIVSYMVLFRLDLPIIRVQ